MVNNKPVLKGTYCILINLNFDAAISIGKLGKINFQRGEYVYVGSALNSLMARIRRHLSSYKKMHWHIDYLLSHDDVEVFDVFYAVDDTRWECELAQKIAEKGFKIKNFGCSDCKCQSHLFYFKKRDDMETCCRDAFENLDLVPERFHSD